MKKLLSILIMLLISIYPVSAEEIEGLDENLNELLMTNYFTEEQFAEIEEKYMKNRSEYLLNEYIPLRQSVNKMETESVEEEYALLMDEGRLVRESALRVSNLSYQTHRYQFGQLGCFGYLFDGKEFWNVLRKNGYSGNYSTLHIDGTTIYDLKEYLGQFHSVADQTKAYNLIIEKETIKNFLLEKGETIVEEIKFFAIERVVTGFYFKCPNEEYILKTYDFNWDIYIDRDEHLEFMTAAQMTAEFDRDIKEFRLNYVTPIKPTFEEEALSLQSEGLLQGNEKGLDLLKPLTRIEAATMLLRAIGESTESEALVQTFTDVPSTHWGFGAAEKAYNLGLIMGVGNNMFAPDNRVTAQQFATMVLRAGEYGEFNWEEALDILIETGILAQDDTTDMDFFTRGDMAKIIYEARENGLF